MGDTQDVLRIAEDLMSNDLSEVDWQPLKSNSHSVRWKNSAQWARLHLSKEGLLSKDSPKGIWEISENGKVYLANSK